MGFQLQVQALVGFQLQVQALVDFQLQVQALAFVRNPQPMNIGKESDVMRLTPIFASATMASMLQNVVEVK